MIGIAMPPNTPVFNVFSYAPLRGSRAQRGLMRACVFDFPGRFAWDVLTFLKKGGTRHAVRDVRVQKPNIQPSKTHCNFDDFEAHYQRMAVSPETSSQNQAMFERDS